MWVEDTYRESESVGDDPNWLRQVGIICDEDRHLELLREGIPKKMRGEVHLRAFLFRLSTQTFCAGVTLVRYIGTE